jgi:hypothetical protein
MLQEINASSLQLASTPQTSVVKSTVDSSVTPTQASSTQSVADSIENVSTSVQGDTVNISHKAMKSYAAFSTNSTANGDTDTSKENITDSNTATLANAANGAGITSNTAEMNTEQDSATAVSTSGSTSSSSDSSSGSTSSSNSLSSYSDSQLQQMLSNGKITQSDYNTELAKRKEKAASSTQATSDNQSLDLDTQNNI